MATDTIIKCKECDSAFSVFDEYEQVWLYPGDLKYCPGCGARLPEHNVAAVRP